MASRALVFRVCGLCQKWKQPAAYCFSPGGTRAEIFEQFLKEVLGACYNAGLQVVVTICNVVANSVKALKLLGVSEMEPTTLQVSQQRNSAVCDPPHLLKCIWKLFHKNDAQLKSELWTFSFLLSLSRSTF
jgi:hypothetical protein